jgi:SNF2 family DNA or RNA helicase
METPACMNPKLVLKPYQKRGLHWLTLVHQQKIGAILADEMGLGKTVQTIAFLGWVKTYYPKFTRPHLVVCPSSVLENWKREFDMWMPGFKVHVYHGEHRRHVLRKIIKANSEGKNEGDRNGYKKYENLIYDFLNFQARDLISFFMPKSFD